MADRKPLKILPDGGGDSTGLGEFVAADTIGVVDGGTGLATVGSNQLLTGNGTSALTSESNLTFDGSTLTVSSSAQIPTEINSSNANPYLVIAAEAETQNDTAGIAFNATKGQAIGGANTMAKIYAKVTNSGGNPLYGNIYFHTTSAETDAEKMIIASDGNVTVSDGDLVIGTSGHGIDFSANSHAGGMTSELLDSYEEGTFTPDCKYDNTSYTNYSGSYGTYVKVGQMVYFNIQSQIDNPSAVNGSEKIYWYGLPFASHAGNSGANQYEFSTHTMRLCYFTEASSYPTPYLGPNTAYLVGWKSFIDGSGWDYIYSSDIYRSSGSNHFVITGSYRVA